MSFRDKLVFLTPGDIKYIICHQGGDFMMALPCRMPDTAGFSEENHIFIT